MAQGAHPPIAHGTIVKTIYSNKDLYGWTQEALASRQWGVRGIVRAHHYYSHGLCYNVQHEDGTMGYYDPSELEVAVINFDELQEEAEKLLALLKDRQHGLMSWNMLMKERMNNMHSLLSKIVT